MTKFWMSQTSFGLIFLQAKPCPLSHTEQHNKYAFFIGPFSKARGLDNKTMWIFWSGWRMISRTLVPLLLYVQCKLGLSNAMSHVSLNLEPKWNWIGEMIKDHVFFCTGFFIFGWMCLICCNNLLVLKWTEIFVLTINQYIPDCFFWCLLVAYSKSSCQMGCWTWAKDRQVTRMFEDRFRCLKFSLLDLDSTKLILDLYLRCLEQVKTHNPKRWWHMVIYDGRD